MSISPISGALPLNLHVSVRGQTRRTESSAFSGRDPQTTLRDLARRIIDLRDSLSRLRSSSVIQTIRSGGPSSVAITSAAPLGLNTEGTATTLSSTEEVNATPRSFSPFGPTVQGSGETTSLPTIGGVYDGDQGDDTLTFKLKDSGDVGDKDIDVEIQDGNGDKIETIRIDKDDPIGTPVTLQNGLTLSLSAGFVKKNDTFTVTVSESVGSVVDPDKPFDGTRNDNPNLQFGQSISAGIFVINGAQITIAANDTLTSSLNKITNSAAGVTASFDVASESVVLTQKNLGSSGSIVLGSDDTGFFAATKLSAASEVLGTDSDLTQPISQVAALSGIGDGSFSINSVSLSIDRAGDSLDDVISRINASAAGVVASFDSVTNKFNLSSKTAGNPVELDDGGSNFFTGVKVADGTYEPSVTTKVQVERRFSHSGELPRLLREFGENLQELFKESADGAAGGPALVATEQLRDVITGAFERVFGDVQGNHLRTGLGIDFVFDDPDKGPLRIDTASLKKSLAERFELLEDFLLADEGAQRSSKGLFPALDDVLDEVAKSLAGDLDPVGGRSLVVDLRV